MKKFISIAATLLLAASTTTAVADAGWVGGSAININSTWYYGTLQPEYDGEGHYNHNNNAWCSGPFSGANLGTLSELKIGGQSKVWDYGNANWGEGNQIMMYIKIDDRNPETYYLNHYKYNNEDHNNYYQSGGVENTEEFRSENIDISSLDYGEHTISVRFDAYQKTDPENSNDWYTATFTKVPLITLEDNSDNSSIITLYDETLANVVLNGRTLVGGQWNTLCLPFEVGNENGFGGTPLAGANVREFFESSLDGGTLTLTFNEAYSISPGVPYIVKPASTVENPVFTGVTIESGLAPVGLDEDYVKFIGTFNPETINGQEYLYLGANDQLYYPSSDVTINSFRAYFELNGITAGEPLSGQQGIKSFVLNFGDDNEETSIKQINNTESATDIYFTLDGRRLNDKPASAGLYIINGKKVVIK